MPLMTPARARRTKAALVRYLTAHGQPVDGIVVSKGVFGPQARDGVRRVKRLLGYRVITDRLDTRVLQAIFSVTCGERAVGYMEADARARVHEIGGNNRGAEIAKRLHAADVDVPAPWCAAELVYAFARGGRILRGFVLAYVPSWVQTARAHRCGLSEVAAKDARRGDAVAFDFNGDGIHDHIGLLRKAVKLGPVLALTTVEGNTQSQQGTGDQSGRSGGDGVFLRTRLMRASRVVFVRVDDVAAAAPAARKAA